ncbi:hypothetical protein DAPPUDRAFT_264726 [Daphnia pulex]|uniref:Uncharacterized protein n=1 Tax=Daphnia pulex TaxID=6669 RepID=E9HS67_DAPPU|nr:hypothetical protein DAPPUDRAFT_264726 [Daphnia pulex]|eukprot:EFX65389.1 hypothetical protein DAPPUDRAFT_264726 [Daphnia pulex]
MTKTTNDDDSHEKVITNQKYSEDESNSQDDLLVLVQYIGLWSSLCKVIPSERMDLYIMVAAILEQGSTDKELRTRVYSEIQKKLRSYSGYQQSSSLDAITSVIPEYSGVGHRVGADRSISGDEVSRDNNPIIEIPTRANPARAEGSKRTSPGNQAVDGSIARKYKG